MRSKVLSLSLATGLVAAIALAGCTTQQKPVPPTTDDYVPYEVSPPTTGAVPRPTPPPPPCGCPTRLSDADWNWSSMAFPTGDAKTSAVCLEKGLPHEVRLNQPFDFMLVVTNLTSNDLQEVVVTDDLGDNFKFNSSDPRADVNPGGVLTWALGTLGAGESVTIRANGTAMAEGSVCNCASVSYNTLLCACVPVVEPRLKLTKTGPSEVLKCEEIVYRFEVSNTGTGSIDNVKITDPLPSGLTAAGGGQMLTFNAGTLAPGASKPFSARVTAERTGRFENKATATGDGGMTATSGVVTTVVRQPVLTITKTCPGLQFIGRPLDYSITVTNTGDGDARDTVLEDVLPAGTTFVRASEGGRVVGNKVVWDLGTMAPKASRTVTMRLNPAGAGMYRNTASAMAYCAATVTDSCSSEVTGIPAILLEVIDIDDPIEVGDNETYVITVTNQGSAPDTNIQIVCTLENAQQYVSSSGATRGSARGQVITFAPLPSLAAQEKAVFRVVAKCVSAGDIRFSVQMTSDQLTRPVEETEATNIYE